MSRRLVFVTVAVFALLLDCISVEAFERARKAGSKRASSARKAAENKPATKPVKTINEKTGGENPTISGKKREKRTSSTKKEQQRKTPVAAGSGFPDDGLLKYTMEHSLGLDGGFVNRTDVTVKILRGGRGAEVKIGGYIFDKDAVKNFKDLVGSDAYYRVQIKPKTKKQSSTEFPMASVKACALEMSGFLEAFTFHLDSFGNVLALDYKTPIVACGGKKPKKKVAEGIKFRSKGRIASVQEGKKPDLTKLILAEKNKAAPQKSFFQKYWMFIAIGVVVLFSAGGA
mmetsp:Transcript_26068/g.41949  ORF Transcript_26068/g.41949 Transcript_26068/m.41949 type:complete len:286 (+) Transcript_26068:104-961(+)